MATINEPVFVDGTLSAGNIAAGFAVIDPVPNTPTSVAVTGVNLVGAGNLFVQVTVQSIVPGTTAVNASITEVESSSFDIVLLRTNDTQTNVWWFATRDAA